MRDTEPGYLPFQVVQHPAARADLRTIALYIAEVDGRPWNAARLLDDFDDYIDSLDIFPEGCQRVSDQPPRPVYCRTFKRAYLVYHEVFEKERIVRILYVWDGRRHDRPDLTRQHDALAP